MGNFPFSELLLLVFSIYGVSRVFRCKNSLPVVIGLLLMSASASVAVLRYAFNQAGLAGIHGLYSSMSASVGMLLIMVSLASFLLPNLLQGARSGLIIIAVTALYAAAGMFHLLSPLVTLSTVIAILAALVAGCSLINIKVYPAGIFAVLTSMLFLLVGTSLEVNEADLFGLISKRDIFYLVLAFWSLSVSLSFRAMSFSGKEK